MNRTLWRLLCAWIVFACLTLSHSQAAPANDRLINISSRSQVGTGGNVMIAGFVVGQGAPKKVLIRAVGPTLTTLNVPGVLADPVLNLHDSAGGLLATNDNWQGADAAIMTDVGAFALPAGSKDAAIVTTLNPGAYTAIVSGTNSGTGVALVEVYDVSGLSRLINISTRARVETGSGILISGLIVGPGAPRKILVRAIGPGLTGLGVSGVLADPTLTLFNSTGGVITSNDNWNATDAALMSQAGAFPLAAGSKDAAMVVELSSGAYTVHVSGVNNTTGVALIEAYDVTPGANSIGPSLSVSAAVSSTAAIGSSPAQVVFSRSGNADAPVTVTYSVSGTATPGVDFTGLPGSITIPAGATSATAFVTAENIAATGTKSATITLAPQSGYELGISSTQVTFHYGSGSLYLANMRVPASVTNSTAYGTSTIQLSADERYLNINLSFSSLSSAQTVAYLRLSNAGEEGAYILKLPNGAQTSAEWQISPSGGFSVADIIAALKAGKLYVSVETTNFPSGELRGTFVASAGSQTFTPPPGPPALGGGAPTPQAAARFLTQATFGATKAEIDGVVSKGYSTWITEQMAAPISVHKDAAQADFNAFNTSATATRPGTTNRQAAWWKIALTGPDQLRQRVAFALSEIFVISDANGTVANWQDGAANYYDLLAKNAFGNFRTLLEDVTLSPMMGVYLSHIRNGKATSTTQPDENYAREIMQLFTIGLHQLQPDGTLKLDQNGLPISTYDQKTITEMAKVFTGWQFYNTAPTTRNFRSGGNTSNDYLQPMTLNPNFHEDSAKTIVSGIQLPANQGGAKDLKDTLDALHNHPNTGPFICRQLIQRLVTSNPSPGYVYRVAQVFANNGSGVRGDLGAVVRAILTDYEARSPNLASNQTFGKLKEPLLRLSHLLRATNASAENGRFNISPPDNAFGQAPLRSPTVFNFFEPYYVVPGSLAAAGLYAPEYQILTDTTAISGPNLLYSHIYATRSATAIGLDLATLPASNPAATLVDHLNLVFCGGSMPTAVKDRIALAITSMPTSATEVEKQRAALYLTVTTQEAAVQK
jgi:uncharacterized protein (DUF1800 family)